MLAGGNIARSVAQPRFIGKETRRVTSDFSSMLFSVCFLAHFFLTDSRLCPNRVRRELSFDGAKDSVCNRFMVLMSGDCFIRARLISS